MQLHTEIWVYLSCVRIDGSRQQSMCPLGWCRSAPLPRTPSLHQDVPLDALPLSDVLVALLDFPAAASAPAKVRRYLVQRCCHGASGRLVCAL